jgi:uncharacterized protein
VTFSAYGMAIETFAPMLRTLSTLLDAGARHASAKGFDPAVLVNARLAPDMYPLVRQVQLACDAAQDGAARLIGKEAPHVENDEQTLDALKARIATTVDYLATLSATAFKGAEDRDISLPLIDDLVLEMKGFQYLRDWALPHFYFHVVTAYDILRHSGVEIGKRDYLSHVGYAVRQRDARQGATAAASAAS